MDEREIRSVVALPLYALAYVTTDLPRAPREWVKIALQRWSSEYERPGYLPRLLEAVTHVREMSGVDLEVFFDFVGDFSDGEIREYLDLLVETLTHSRS